MSVFTHSCYRVRLSRRELLRLGLGIVGAATLGDVARPRGARADGVPPTPIRFTPFTRELPIPRTLVSVSGLFDGMASTLSEGLPATASREL